MGFEEDRVYVDLVPTLGDREVVSDGHSAQEKYRIDQKRNKESEESQFYLRLFI